MNERRPQHLDADDVAIHRALRDAHSAPTPAFQTTWDAAVRRRPSSTRRRQLTFAAAAALCLAVGAVVVGVALDDSPPAKRGASAVAVAVAPVSEAPTEGAASAPTTIPVAWRGPTDFLLETPGSARLATLPSLNMLDLSSSAATTGAGRDATPSRGM